MASPWKGALFGLPLIVALMSSASGSGVPNGLTTTFGALTAAGAGGVPVTGTSIASGDPSGHFQISGGLLSPSTAGNAASLNAGPYSLVMSDGQVVTVTVVAGQRSVRTSAEAVSAIASAGAGETVQQRAVTIPTLSLSGLTKTNVTYTSEPGAIIGQADLTNVVGLAFDGIVFFKDNSTGPDNAGDQTGALVWLSGASTNPNFLNCTFMSHTGYTPALKKKRMTGIRSGSAGIGAISATGALFDHLYNGITTHAATSVTTTDSVFQHIYQDGIGGSAYAWSIQRNDFSQFEGDYGSQFPVSFDSGTPVAGEIYSYGSGTSQQIMEIVAVDTVNGWVNAYYNLFAKPDIGHAFVGPSGKQITVTGAADSTAFSGIHGDGAQPIMNDGSLAGNVTSLVFKDNIIRRINPFDHSVRQVEQGLQGLLAQTNASGFHWEEIDVQGNVYLGGQDIGFTVRGALGGTLAYNTCLSAEYYTSTSSIRLGESSGVAVYSNVGDNGVDGPVSGVSPYTVDSDPSNSNLTVTNKGGTRVAAGAQTLAAFPTIFTYPQTRETLAPQAGSTVDLAGSGALNTDGTLRAQTPPAALPTILDASSTNASSASSATASASYTAPAGSNRRVLVAASWEAPSGSGVNDIISVTTDTGATFTKIVTQGATSATGAGTVLNGIGFFELPEADIPAGAFTVTVTVNGAVVPDYLLMRVVTLGNAPNAPTHVQMGTASASATPPQIDTPVAVDNSLLVSAFATNNSASTAGFTTGIAKWSPSLILGTTTTLAFGSQANVPAGTQAAAGSSYTGSGVDVALINLVFAP